MKNKPVQQPINDRIRADFLQVITSTGDNLGVISRSEALLKAQETGLDLVLIADSGNEGAPVAKIMDFGKALYSKKKKQTEAKKNQKQIKIKEVKIRPKIGEHDYMTKLNQGMRFLKDGMRLKVTLVFRGRENAHKAELAPALFARVERTFEDEGMTNLIRENESRAGQFWSRVYYTKS